MQWEVKLNLLAAYIKLNFHGYSLAQIVWYIGGMQIVGTIIWNDINVNNIPIEQVIKEIYGREIV
jgi:hypothetical protein